MIELREVHKTFQTGKVAFEALKDVSFQVPSGAFAVITGPSGSGKSTLMTLIGCLDSPTSGTVLIDETDVSKLSRDEVAAIRNTKLGFVFQQFNLMPTLNALDNVALPLELAGKSRSEAVDRASSLMDKVGLNDKKNSFPRELSGGQMQRVAIARALANNPEIILADEPTGNLDSATGKEVIKLLGNLNKEGKTVLLITHDPSLSKLGNLHFLIKDGRIVK